jgi:SAM-dependent methyltransferase
MANRLVKIGHQLLKFQPAYDFYQNIVGGVSYRNSIVETLASLGKPAYLDLGCGTATIAKKLNSSTRYIGIDNSDNYLKKARGTFPQHQFFNKNLGQENWNIGLGEIGSTVATGLGLLHHLDDRDAIIFLESCRSVLDKDSLLFTVDPVIVNDTSSIARWFAMNDRGKFVRKPEQLEKMFRHAGFSPKVEIKKKQFRIPLDTVEILALPD